MSITDLIAAAETQRIETLAQVDALQAELDHAVNVAAALELNVESLVASDWYQDRAELVEQLRRRL